MKLHFTHCILLFPQCAVENITINIKKIHSTKNFQ